MARKSSRDDESSMSHRGSDFSLASSGLNIVDGVGLTYYPETLEVQNAGLFSGTYQKIKFYANGAPRYRSDSADAIGDHHFIYKNEDGGWWFAVGEHQVLMNGGSYKTRFPAKQPHLHSAKWMQCCVTYKNQNSLGDPYWVSYPQIVIKDTTDINDGEDGGDVAAGGVTAMATTERVDDTFDEYDQNVDEYGAQSVSSSSTSSTTTGLKRIFREQRHAEEPKYHPSIGWTTPGTPVVDLLIEADLAYSIADARRCIRLRLVYLDEELVEELDEIWADTAFGDYPLEVQDRGKAVIELIQDIPEEPDWAIASRNFRFKKPTKKQMEEKEKANRPKPKSVALQKFEADAATAKPLDESGDLW